VSYSNFPKYFISGYRELLSFEGGKLKVLPIPVYGKGMYMFLAIYNRYMVLFFPILQLFELPELPIY
jgi:hypothetical protein